MARIVCEWERVCVTDDAVVHTPTGSGSLLQVDVAHTASHAHVSSGASWSLGWVLIACLLAVFTCGLGLLALLLARRERVGTQLVDVVTISGPGWAYTGARAGGAAFAAWAQAWATQLRAEQATASMRAGVLHHPFGITGGPEAAPPPPRLGIDP